MIHPETYLSLTTEVIMRLACPLHEMGARINSEQTRLQCKGYLYINSIILSTVDTRNTESGRRIFLRKAR